MKLVNVLIDYDNVRLSKENQASDVVINLNLLFPALAAAIHSVVPGSEEAWCRLYGGWIHLNGRETHQHGWLLSELSRMRGRRGPLRTKIAMATELTCRSDLTLIGTYRDKGQKMVDGMISTDLISLSKDADFALVLVSDDEDFVPSIIASAGHRPRSSPLYVLRRSKALNKAPNDHLLKSCNVVVATF